MAQVEQGRVAYQKFNRRLLHELVDAETVSPELAQELVEKYPDYIPHNVLLDFVDEAITKSGVGSTLNVAESGVMKAIGSTRQIQDPFSAIVSRAPKLFSIAEKNRTQRALIDLYRKTPEAFPGMEALRTSEQVRERIAIYAHLKNLRPILKNRIKELRKTKQFDEATASKLSNLDKQIDEIEKEIVENLNIFFSESDEFAVQFRGRVAGEETRVATILQELEMLANKVREFKPKGLVPKGLASKEVKKGELREFLKSNIALKEFEEGTLEKFGIRSREAFYKMVKEPFTKLEERVVARPLKEITEEVAEKALGKARGARADIARTEELFETEKLKKASAEDAVSFLEDAVEGLKETRKILFEDAKRLFDKKISPLALQEAGLGRINLFRNGIREDWIVPADLETAIKNLDAEQVGTLMRWAAMPANILRAGATRFNLSFALPNFARDIQTALITSELSAQGFISGMARTKEHEQLIRLWRDSGGIGASIFRDAKPAENVMKQLENLSWYQAKNANPLHIIETITSATEQATRLSVFKRMLDKGLSPRRAAYEARNATIDFDKMGTWMRNVNRVVPFLNARVQGFTIVAKALAKNPTTFSRRVMWTGAMPTMFLHQHNRQFESYNQIPTWLKNRNWVIMVGESTGRNEQGEEIIIPQFVTVVKGEAQQVVANPLQYFLDFADGNDPRSVGEMLVDTVGGLSPLEFQSFSQRNGWLAFLSNLGPLVTVPVGLATNKEPFTGFDIVPESRKKASPELQTRRTTKSSSKQIAKLLGVSPARAEFVMGSFGGLEVDILSTSDIAQGDLPPAKSDTGWGKAATLPVVRRFIREMDDRGVEFEKNTKIKEEAERVAADKSLTARDRAEEIIKNVDKGATRAEQTDILRSALNAISDKEEKKEITDKMRSIRKSRQTTEVLRPSDSVEVRALYIRTRLEMMNTRKEQLEFLKELQSSGILTDAVKERMRKLNQ